MKYVRRICCAILLLVIGILVGLCLNMGNPDEEPSQVYQGNAYDILEQHSLLLDHIAEFLWNTPEVFQAVREGNESYSHVNIDELCSFPSIRKALSSDEIQLLQDVASVTYLFDIGMYFPVYGRAKAVTFDFLCPNYGQNELIYIRPADDIPDSQKAIQRNELLKYMTYEWVNYQPTEYPYWFKENRLDMNK